MTRLDDLKAERAELNKKLLEIQRAIDTEARQGLVAALQAYKPFDDAMYRVVWDTPEEGLNPGTYRSASDAHAQLVEWALNAQDRYNVDFEFQPNRVHIPHATHDRHGREMWMDVFLERKTD